MRVAIIGLGEVGRCYAAPLQAHGVELSLCEARPSAAAQALADEWGTPIHASAGAWLQDADWVLSCVTGAQALAVNRRRRTCAVGQRWPTSPPPALT